MRKVWLYLLCVCVAFATAACSDDDAPRTVAPDAVGTFVDERDGYVYHYVRYGDQEWTCENSHFIIRDGVVCSVYQGPELESNTNDFDDFFMTYYDKYGCLYTYEAALRAAPEGWRLPTDEDWQKLERHLGMSAEEAAGLDWRGNVATQMMERTEDYSGMNILLGGYYTNYITGGILYWRYMGVYGYYWTATQDAAKGEGYYFARKFVYNKSAVWRQSMEGSNYQLYVRFVRDVK